MSKKNYETFREGLKDGIRALWRPHFMSGVRNGGFEQTLRNVCVPYIEAATGRMAFTEADERGDLILRGLKPDQTASTRCEFKTNFACQLDDIEDRSEQAIRQARTSSAHPNQDGIAVYAVAELVFSGKQITGYARLHNESVKSPKYKIFRDQDTSAAQMQSVCAALKVRGALKQPYEPLFSRALPKLSFPDKSGFARLHVWTYYIPAQR